MMSETARRLGPIVRRAGVIPGTGFDPERRATFRAGHRPAMLPFLAYAETAPMRTSHSLPPRPCQIWHED
jgi:hypothetical protein